MIRARIFSLLSLLAVLLAASLGAGQTATTGAIAGSVVDPSGAVIPNATVEVLNNATNAVVRSANTDSQGNFVLPLLDPGSYRLEIQASGFRKLLVPAITVRVTETSKLDARLEVGSLEQGDGSWGHGASG